MRGQYYLGVTPGGGGVLCLLRPLLRDGGLTQRLARVLPVSRGLLKQVLLEASANQRPVSSNHDQSGRIRGQY